MAAGGGLRSSHAGTSLLLSTNIFYSFYHLVDCTNIIVELIFICTLFICTVFFLINQGFLLNITYFIAVWPFTVDRYILTVEN